MEYEAFPLSGQLVGTPEYMRPEQASLNSRDIDTGTEIYSLGVVLYECAGGHTSLDIKAPPEIGTRRDPASHTGVEAMSRNLG